MWKWVSGKIDTMVAVTAQWSVARKDAFCPPFVAGLMKVR